MNRRYRAGTSVFLSVILFWGATAMAQEEKKEAAAGEAAKTRTLGVVIFPGFELLDLYGPLEMWGNLQPPVKIAVIAKEKGAVASHQGPKTVAEYSFADAPDLDLILVPGGLGVLNILNDPELKEFLKSRSAKAEITMSVCNGATLLATAGLLDGKKATTNKAFWKVVTAPGPNVKWVKQARWVDEGNIVTSSGVSAGIDMTLHVIARLYGKAAAEGLANGTEYDWHQDPNWDPFAKLHGLVESE